MPTCSLECSGFVCSITTTTSIVNKTTAVPASDTFRNSPLLPSRQKPCTPLLLPKPHQLPDIEDVDEDSTTVTPPTVGDSKHTQSSCGSENQGTEGDYILKSLVMTSALPSPVLAITDTMLPAMSTVSMHQSQKLESNLTSFIEPIDKISLLSSKKPTKQSFRMDQRETNLIVHRTAEDSQKDHNLTDTCLNMSKMVASLSTLSSWSSTASVATRTNTDNPASLSHIVTNFNITRSAKAAVNQQQDLPAVTTSALAASSIAHNIFSESSNSTTKLETLTTALSSTATQMSQNVTISKMNMTTTALLKYTAITSQHKLRFRQDQAPDSDDSKEYTPMKVFKQTPV